MSYYYFLFFSYKTLISNLLSRPISYISYHVKSNDGQLHKVQIYLGVSNDIAINITSQEVAAQQLTSVNLSLLKAGTVAQPVLQKKGDDQRINWGYLYSCSFS